MIAARLAEGIEALVATLRLSVVAVRDGDARGSGNGRSGGGSGTVWRDGLVLTNAHVARGERAAVETWDGRSAVARVVRRDTDEDLAALEVDGFDLRPLEVRLDEARAGELAIAVGHPWGARGDATVGVVARAAGDHDRLVATDARLAPGNSGGPLVDAWGRVLGINAMVAGALGLAVPSARVEAFLAAEVGVAAPAGRLGVVGVLVPVDIEGAYEGLLITDVAPGSAAEAAGLLPGDIVLRVDGSGSDGRALLRALAVLAASHPVAVDLLRGGHVRSIEVLAAAA